MVTGMVPVQPLLSLSWNGWRVKCADRALAEEHNREAWTNGLWSSARWRKVCWSRRTAGPLFMVAGGQGRARESGRRNTQVWANERVRSLDECEGIHPETGGVTLALLLASLGIFAKYSKVGSILRPGAIYNPAAGLEVRFEAARLGWVSDVSGSHMDQTVPLQRLTAVTSESDRHRIVFFILSLNSLFHLPAQTNIKETWKWLICFWPRATLFSFNIFLLHQTISKMYVGCGLNVSLKCWM